MINKLAFKLNVPSRFSGMMPILNSGRLEPSFFIAGFQKCGTTSVYDALSKHPSILPGLMKENNMLFDHHDRIEEFKLSFPYKKSGKITGDASHLHTWNPKGMERIKKHFPKAKIILIMRNPIDRAYSHFNMDRNTGYFDSNLSFDDYISIELKLREHISKEDDVTEVYKAMRFYGNRFGWALSRGVYYMHIQRIQEMGFEVLPLFLEHWNEDLDGSWSNLCQFLGLETVSIELEPRNRGQYNQPMSTAAAERLKLFYEGPNQKLAQLLQHNLPWN